MNEQGDHVSYRVIAFGDDGTEILLTRADSGLQFPEVMIPQWKRVAENLTCAVERQWGQKVVCLFEPDSPVFAGSRRYMVARHWRACGSTPIPLQWISVSELAVNLFADVNDYRAMHEILAKCGASVPKGEIGAFARLSSFEELCDWIGKAIASSGLHLTGDFRQLNACPTFSLVRFETNGPAVWFKAVGEPNQREFSITLKLARFFPQYTPELLAARSDWSGWLTRDVPGINLAETSDLGLWERAAAAFAKLQIESIGHCRPFLDAGAHDLKIAALAQTVPSFMAVIAGLMSQQTTVPPPVLAEAQLTQLGERIYGAMSEFAQLPIPDTLGHLDLNPGNIFVNARDGCVFLDWAEAYVGHPFYSFQYLLQHLRRIRVVDPGAEAAFTASYLAPWKRIAPPAVLAEAMALAPLLAAFAYAAGGGAWREPETLRDPKLAGYLRSLARRMNREADQLSERTAPCPS